MKETLVDFTQIAVGGVALIPMIVGLMQFSKKFGLSGRGLMIVSAVVLLVFGGVAGAINEGLIPEPALPWIRVAVYSLGFLVTGLAAMGLYDVAKKIRELPAIEGEMLFTGPPPGPEVMHRPLSGRKG